MFDCFLTGDGELLLTKISPLPEQITEGNSGKHANIILGQQATFLCQITGATATPDLSLIYSNITNVYDGM